MRNRFITRHEDLSHNFKLVSARVGENYARNPVTVHWKQERPRIREIILFSGEPDYSPFYFESDLVAIM